MSSSQQEMHVVRMECNLDGAPYGRRKPEAFGKDGCPEQHTGSSVT